LFRGSLAAFGWALLHGLEAVSADDLYVASFSEKADLLSQWRGYCPAGAGLCLGFDFDRMMNFCHSSGYRLNQCIYEHGKQIQQIEALVNECLERCPKPPLARADYESLDAEGQVNVEINYMIQTSEGPDKPQFEAAVSWLCAELSELAPLFKNEGFHEESEWRIVAKCPKVPVKFRASSSYIAPYVELAILSDPADSGLREVIVGPNPNQLRCKYSIKKLLDACGLGDVVVRTSSLPLNSW
jgi:hypothetical protein